MKEQTLLGSTEETAEEREDYEYELPDDDVEASIDIEELIDHLNIAELLDDETLDKLALDVIDTYNMDKASRSHREKSMDEAMNLALQVMEEKTFPWPNASSVSYPIITESAITFAARAYPAIVRGDQIAMGKVIGSDAGMPQPIIDPMTGQPPIDPNTGQMAIDPNTGQPPIQMVGQGEKKAKSKRIADYMNYQLMEEIEGWEEDTDKLLTALPIVGNMYRKLYWNAELGRPEACLVYPRHLVVNYKAKSLERAPRITEEVELYPHEIIERIRLGTFIDFDFEQATEGDTALSDRDRSAELQSDWNNPHLHLQQYRKIDLDGDGYPEPYIVTVHKDTAKVVRIKANYHEDNIKKNKKGEIAKIKCEEYYIKYGFIPSPDGAFYDLGWGELLLSLNKTINATVNRLMDAGTLANTSQGFLARGVKIQGGESRFKPGQFKSVDTRGMPLKDAFVQIQHPEPSTVMFQLLGTLVDAAKSLGSLRDVLSGEQVANQSGIAALTLIEQGLTGFKSIYKRVYRSVKQELKLLYRINAIYLDDTQYFNIMDSEQAIARQDFDIKSVDVIPAADPTVVTDMQRMAKAQFMMEFLQDPYFEPKKTREKIFEYMGEDSEDIIVDAPPAPQDPMIELQQAMTQVEQYKAQIKEQEAQAKTQREAQAFQLDQAKAEHQARLNQVSADAKARADEMAMAIKSQEAQMKMAAQVHELEMKRAELASKGNKDDMEVRKIAAQIDEIYAKIELARQTHIKTVQEKAEKEAKEESTSEEKRENTDKLAEAVKSLKGKRTVTVKKDASGDITAEIK